MPMNLLPFVPLAAMPGKFRLALGRPLPGVEEGRRAVLFLWRESAARVRDGGPGRAPWVGAAE